MQIYTENDYAVDRARLNVILLNSRDVGFNRNEILDLVPELSICVKCTQNNPAHMYNVYGHIEETVNKVDSDILLKLSALFHDIGKPYSKYYERGVERFTGHWNKSVIVTDLTLRRLGYSTDIINKVCTLVKYHDYLTEPTKNVVQSTIDLVGENLMPYLLKLKRADILTHSPIYCEMRMRSLDNIVSVYKKYFNKSFKL